MRRILAGTIVLGLIVVWLARSPESIARYAEVPQNKALADGRFKGAGSCSAVACHGSIAPVPGSDVLRNEHTTWISDDPHARAYQTLYRELSKDIVSRLAGGKCPDVPAHEDPRCLACHTTPRTKVEREQTSWLNQDGVSCESCHGASKDWLGPHTTTWWKDVDGSVKETIYGLVDTKELTRRTEVCTKCHIGHLVREGKDKTLVDVNHDLIAAGHPRLSFEFAAYHDRMPAHWVEKGRNRCLDFPARAWAVGQLVSAKASLTLLQGRADKTLMAPWPEFSEYDCFSCHHNLADEAWRRNALDMAAPRGLAPWGSWYFPMTFALTESRVVRRPKGDNREFGTPFRELLELMNQPVPDQDKIAARVDDCIALIDRELKGLTRTVLDGPTVERLIRGLDCADAWKTVRSWDHATQRYLALVALRQAWSRLDQDQREEQGRLGDELKQLLQELQFKGAQNSPSGFDPARVVPGR